MMFDRLRRSFTGRVGTERQPGWVAAIGRIPAVRWVGLVAALVLLNVSLTFTNIWPTLGVRLNADLSVETALCVLGLVLVRRWHCGPGRVALRWLAGLWIVLVVGRYVEVTTASLYGRDINLYWDVQHMPNVGAMFAFVADPWLKVAVVAGVVLVPVLFYVIARWALGSVAEATHDPRARRALGLVAAGVLLLSIAQPLGARRRGGAGGALPGGAPDELHRPLGGPVRRRLPAHPEPDRVHRPELGTNPSPENLFL